MLWLPIEISCASCVFVGASYMRGAVRVYTHTLSFVPAASSLLYQPKAFGSNPKAPMSNMW
jgi:hypothetical protein